MAEKTLQEMDRAELLSFIIQHKKTFDDANDAFRKTRTLIAPIDAAHKKLIEGDKENAAVVNEIQNIFNEAKANQKTIAGMLSATTTIALAREFSNKVAEYYQIRRRWEISALAAFGVCLFASVVSLLLFQPTSLDDLYLYFARVLPFFGIVIWAITFMLNRRSENKILEESYKHKETMAKMYEGYKSSIKEIDPDRHDNLQATLMHSMVDAIDKDSSAFLTTKGDKYPTTEAIQKLIQGVRNSHTHGR